MCKAGNIQIETKRNWKCMNILTWLKPADHRVLFMSSSNRMEYSELSYLSEVSVGRERSFQWAVHIRGGMNCPLEMLL